MSAKKALIVGATGLVGKALVKHLLEKDSYEEITILTRRDLGFKDDRLKIVLVSDFDKLSEYSKQMNTDDIYCTLGTTRKKAGSKENFIKIDLEYPLELARLTKDQPNFKQFLVVTSLGANSQSPLFYNETKGKLEEALVALEIKSLSIFQPSLLLGSRDEFRLLEAIGKFFSALLSFFVVGSKKRLWAIKGEEVAEAMYMVSKKNESGLKYYKPNDMLKMIYAW
ncbi:MAG: NAD-dependent epimerase/dehydratase family protein [Cyclobacteriaceae bacterium]